MKDSYSKSNIGVNISVKFLYFKVRGMALIRDWYDQVGSVEMTPYEVNDLADVDSKINDGKFGAQEILGAKLRIFAVYGPENQLMFPGYTPLMLPIDTKFVSYMNENEPLDDEFIDFLNKSDTTSPMYMF